MYVYMYVVYGNIVIIVLFHLQDSVTIYDNKRLQYYTFCNVQRDRACDAHILITDIYVTSFKK